MEQETSRHFVRRCALTNTFPRIRIREWLFLKVSKRLRPLAARMCAALAASTGRSCDLKEIICLGILKCVLILSTLVLEMSTTTGLADLLFGRTRGAVLALLYGRADQSFYTREIAREIDASVGAVQRELENLSKVGLILRKSVGSQVHYQANRETPIFPEMRALINKTIGVFGVLRSALRPLSKQIIAAFVYGSVAREQETAQSDVDLMVVGKATLDQVLSRVSTTEKAIGRSINPTVYSVAEFKSKLATENHFLTSVLKGQKVFLLGDEDELRKMGGIRLAKAGTE